MSLVRALTTYETAADQLGRDSGSNRSRIEFLIQRATADIETICSRRFSRDDGIVEYHRAEGPQRLYVKQWPVRNLVSVKFAQRGEDADAAYTVPTNEYDWESEKHRGRIRFQYPLFNRTWITDRISGRPVSETAEYDYRIEYDGGYMTPRQDADDDPDEAVRDLPYDLEGVCLDLVAHYFLMDGSDRGIRQEGIGEDNVAHERRMMGIPMTLYSKIKQYKRLHVR